MNTLKKTFLKYCSIFPLLIHIVYSLKCGENYIEGCQECDLGINSSQCKTCSNKYFLTLDGTKCIKCDHIYLGMAGCDGNCMMTQPENKIKCEENKCKEGFYEIQPGICETCSSAFKGCEKCSYLTVNNKKEFNCLECNNNFYPSSRYNKCKECYLQNCKRCLNFTFCKECDENYVSYPDGTCYYYDYNCKKALYSEEKRRPICLECKSSYVLYPNGTCFGFNSNCNKEIYSEEKGKAICLECKSSYALYPNGTCLYYDYYCQSAIYLEETRKAICLVCKSSYTLYPNGTCLYYHDITCDKAIYSEEKGREICQECSSSNVLYPNGTCLHSDNYGCKKVIYSEKKGKFICIECRTSYVLYPNETCLYYNNYCKKAIYSEEKGKAICLECYDNYFKSNDICFFKGYNCKKSFYWEERNEVICLECAPGYYLDQKNECKSCSNYYIGDYFYYCKYCHKEKDKILCDKIDVDEQDRYYLASSGEFIRKCSDKIPGCLLCSFHSEEDSEYNILKCNLCKTYTTLSSDHLSCEECILTPNGSCLYYKEVFGPGCSNALISKMDFSPFCNECLSGYIKGNDGKCKDCEYGSHIIGCKECDIINNQIICLDCKDGYMFFKGKCIAITDVDYSNCTKIENIGSENELLYSCIKCKFENNIFAVKSNYVKICIDPLGIPELYDCKLSKKEITGNNNYTCIECINNIKLEYSVFYKKEICESCIDGYYSSRSYGSNKHVYCYDCNGYKNHNCMKCNNGVTCEVCLYGYYKNNKSECQTCPYYCDGCFLNENSEVICENIINNYFLNNSKAEYCLDHLNGCDQCSFSENNLRCDKCVDNYFLNKNNICVNCTLNKDISLSCLSCTDDENIKVNFPCQKCKGKNYFLTKLNTCIFCNSINYGGTNCAQCDYININGNEIIGCVNCPSPFKLTVDGKCINISITNCKKYNTYINENNMIKIGCIECEENFYVTKNKTCDFMDLFPEDYNQIIEGCLQYGINNSIYYCLLCEPNYNLSNGFCFKPSSNLLNNPFLEFCKNLIYENGFWKCNDCFYGSFSYLNFYPFRPIKLDSIQVCKNKFYGFCSSYTNLGNDSAPIYSCSDCSNNQVIIYENGVETCFTSDISHCLEAKVNTSYYQDMYNCIKCYSTYKLLYDNYNERIECKYIDNYEYHEYIPSYDSDEGLPTKDGKCADGYFTRNGKICIKCDNSTIGMIGCGGRCLFNSSNKIKLRCEENKCKEEYFEILPGVCELCNAVISGCQRCKYILNEKKIILKPERVRNLICLKCGDGLFISNNGSCQSCSTVFLGCKNCKEVNNKTVCIKADNGYYLDEEGNIRKCKPNCKECSIIYQDGIKKLICIKAMLGYYLDRNRKLIQCEENCSECLLLNENGINKLKCIDEDYYYFTNNEGKKIKCSDEIEGIFGCKRCEFNSELICNFCDKNYKLLENKCISIEEYNNLEGCLTYEYNNSTFNCTKCKRNYFYNDYLKKCEEKTEKLEFCNEIKIIKLGNKFIYNCTSCDSFYRLVRNNDNYFTCYYEYLLYDMSNCNLIINIGTFKEPFFICESCKYYDYYSIAVDDYGNQICENYNKYGKGCIKGRKINNGYGIDSSQYYEIYDYLYQYNCLECGNNYILEYDDFTKVNKCIPLDCQVPHCYECFQDNVYICKQCDEGYNFTKLRKCYIIPEISPVITFKDIFMFEFNQIMRQNSLFRFSYYLRGITVHKIKLKHSFIISTMFSIKTKLRLLEETDKYKTFCEFENEINNDNGDIKFVDYKCYFDADKDLRDYYKMELLTEDEYKDIHNLIALNLEYFIKDLENTEKNKSSLDQDELNKYILFIVDDKSKFILIGNNNNFNFSINGKTNKIIDNNLYGFLSFLNTDNKKAVCEINATDKDNAVLTCNTNITDIRMNNLNFNISFKEQEILGKNNNIYFDGLNEVILSYIIENNNNNNIEENNKNKNKVGLIVGLIIGFLVLIAIIIISIYFFKRFMKSKIEENKIKPADINIKVFKNEFNNNINEVGSKDTMNNNPDMN